jgi:hypothetical protein
MRAPTPALKVTDPKREVRETLSRSETAAHRDVQRQGAVDGVRRFCDDVISDRHVG